MATGPVPGPSGTERGITLFQAGMEQLDGFVPVATPQRCRLRATPASSGGAVKNAPGVSAARSHSR